MPRVGGGSRASVSHRALYTSPYRACHTRSRAKGKLHLFEAQVEPHGIVLFSPLRLRLWEMRFREPDLLLLLDAADPRNGERYWTGADLVLEIVSPDNPERDLVVKRAEYALAGTPEYWIVNPLDSSVTVLTLAGDTYREHGRFTGAARATSPLLPHLTVEPAALFAQ